MTKHYTDAKQIAYISLMELKKNSTKTFFSNNNTLFTTYENINLNFNSHELSFGSMWNLLFIQMEKNQDRINYMFFKAL